MNQAQTFPSILIAASRLSLDLENGLFPSGFPTKMMYEFLIFSIRATCPTHSIVFDFIYVIFGGVAVAEAV
jgi:hypothetical protein